MKLDSMIVNSLITKSGIIQIGLVLGGIFALMCLATGQYFFAAALLGMGALGLGVSIHNYRQWEVGEMVPGFREAQATTAVKLALLCWGLVSTFSLVNHGVSMASLALYLIVIAYLLCVGVGVPVLSSPLLNIGIAVATVLLWGYIQHAIETSAILPKTFRQVAGFGLILAGFGLLKLAWNQAVIYVEPKANVEVNAVQEKKFAKDESLGFTDSNRTVSLWRRTERLTNGFGWQAAALLLPVVLICFIFWWVDSPHTDVPMHLFAGILLMTVPVMLFMSRVPKSFERLWLMGAESTRFQTSTRLFKLTGFKCLACTLVISLALMSQHSEWRSGWAASLCFTLVATALGFVFLWLAARNFRFWKARAKAAILCFLIMVTFVSIFLIMLFHGQEDVLVKTVHRFGTQESLTVCFLGTFVVWLICYFDGARAIAKQQTLME